MIFEAFQATITRRISYIKTLLNLRQEYNCQLHFLLILKVKRLKLLHVPHDLNLYKQRKSLNLLCYNNTLPVIVLKVLVQWLHLIRVEI